ncbi:hypothetical protein PM082_015407 [Marasmius tenuissimus]|nr:hypothetical protein PM082_015407 [Marasmius tenuissimus]
MAGDRRATVPTYLVSELPLQRSRSDDAYCRCIYSIFRILELGLGFGPQKLELSCTSPRPQRHLYSICAHPSTIMIATVTISSSETRKQVVSLSLDTTLDLVHPFPKCPPTHPSPPRNNHTLSYRGTNDWQIGPMPTGDTVTENWRLQVDGGDTTLSLSDGHRCLQHKAALNAVEWIDRSLD